MIYVVHAEGTNRYKIGKADKPEERLMALQTGSPLALSIALLSIGGEPEERELHRRFSGHRLHGEWFAFDDLTALKEALPRQLEMPIPPKACPPIEDFLSTAVTEQWGAYQSLLKSKAAAGAVPNGDEAFDAFIAGANIAGYLQDTARSQHANAKSSFEYKQEEYQRTVKKNRAEEKRWHAECERQEGRGL